MERVDEEDEGQYGMGDEKANPASSSESELDTKQVHQPSIHQLAAED